VFPKKGGWTGVIKLIGDCTSESGVALFNETANCGNFVVYQAIFIGEPFFIIFLENRHRLRASLTRAAVPPL
jgi:hypothetical protein